MSKLVLALGLAPVALLNAPSASPSAASLKLTPIHSRFSRLSRRQGELRGTALLVRTSFLFLILLTAEIAFASIAEQKGSSSVMPSSVALPTPKVRQTFDCTTLYEANRVLTKAFTLEVFRSMDQSSSRKEKVNTLRSLVIVDDLPPLAALLAEQAISSLRGGSDIRLSTFKSSNSSLRAKLDAINRTADIISSSLALIVDGDLNKALQAEIDYDKHFVERCAV